MVRLAGRPSRTLSSSHSWSKNVVVDLAFGQRRTSIMGRASGSAMTDQVGRKERDGHVLLIGQVVEAGEVVGDDRRAGRRRRGRGAPGRRPPSSTAMFEAVARWYSPAVVVR